MYRRHPLEQADLKCNEPVSRVFTYMCAGAPVGTRLSSLITLHSFTKAPQWPTAHQVGEAGWPANPGVRKSSLPHQTVPECTVYCGYSAQTQVLMSVGQAHLPLNYLSSPM